jgi:hypothetical protein
VINARLSATLFPHHYAVLKKIRLEGTGQFSSCFLKLSIPIVSEQQRFDCTTGARLLPEI